MGTPGASPVASPAGGGSPFGSIDGKPVSRYILSNGNGMMVSVLNYGGIIQQLMVPDKDGTAGNIVLGFDNLDGYIRLSPYFGAIVGRYANRIAKGKFTLGGKEYTLALNNGENSLHGGEKGFDKQVWDASDVTKNSVTLTLVSPDGDEGYPGELTVHVTYTVTDNNELQIDYSATTDALTVLNLSNHSYFNLAGEGTGTIYDHELQFNCSKFTPVDSTLIPTGELMDVAETPFDFTTAKPIGQDIRDGSNQQLLIGMGYDHNFVVDGWDGKTMQPVATVTEPTSGRTMSVTSDQPGVQFYTGNFLNGAFAGTSDKIYRQGDAFALETQHFPDSPNQPDFPTTELKPGEEFTSQTVFTFGVA